ncbi:MAG TPA: hypothetical protein VJT69_10530 [Pyrinomonadaceae bacterium]|nr:hypothetical protein [Pyrinomonadaceae bacterium]
MKTFESSANFFLRRTSRMALQSEWTGGKEDAAAFCTDQYNPVLTREYRRVAATQEGGRSH